LQRVDNPVPRVRHPDWLHRRVAEKEDTHKQTKLDALFAAAGKKSAAQQAQRAAAAVGDLEDFGDFGAARGNGATGISPAVGIASTVEVTPAGTDSGAENTAPGNNGAAGANAHGGKPAAEPAPQKEVIKETPPRHESFNRWLAAKKAQWKHSRTERKRRREANPTTAGGDGRRVRQRAATGVDGMFQQQADAAAGAAWQIVSYSPTPLPGVNKVWAVINGRMHAIPVRVPRTFYVDAILGPDDAALAALTAGGSTVQLVRRTLPAGADAHYTYQVTMSEEVYRSTLPKLEAALSHPGVRGVYEARVPPEWTAALSTGCVAVVAPGARGRNLGAGFDLSELQARPVVQYGYFSTPDTPPLRHMLLHHSLDAARGRGIYALHLPADGVCHVWVVNPARGGQREITSGMMDRAWNEERDSFSAQMQGTDAEEEPLELPEAPRCEVVYVRNFDIALKALQKLLGRIK
jgi:DNA polymerase epsilon subunit 1